MDKLFTSKTLKLKTYENSHLCVDVGSAYKISHLDNCTEGLFQKTGVSTVRNFYNHDFAESIMVECLIDGTINYYRMDNKNNIKILEFELMYSHNFYGKTIYSHNFIQINHLYFIIIEDSENLYLIGKNLFQIHSKKNEDSFITIKHYDLYVISGCNLHMNFTYKYGEKSNVSGIQLYDFNSNKNQNYCRNLISGDITPMPTVYEDFIKEDIIEKIFKKYTIYKDQILNDELDEYSLFTFNNSITIKDENNNSVCITKVNPITIQKLYKINDRNIYIHCELDGTIFYYEIHDAYLENDEYQVNEIDMKYEFLFNHKLIDGPIYSYNYFYSFYHYLLIENKDYFYIFRNMILLSKISKLDISSKLDIKNNDKIVVKRIFRRQYTKIHINFTNTRDNNLNYYIYV